jgi:hypothetical protein
MRSKRQVFLVVKEVAKISRSTSPECVDPVRSGPRYARPARSHGAGRALAKRCRKKSQALALALLRLPLKRRHFWLVFHVKNFRHYCA